MPSLGSFLDLFTKLQRADVTVNQQRCILVRNRNAGCERCAEACTSGCISFVDDEIVITPDKCTACGTCATACPTGALSPTQPNDNDLIKECYQAREAADGQVVIACSEMLAAADGLYDTNKVVKVGCLGRVDESLLITLAATGSVHMQLVHGDCTTCEKKTGSEVAETVCACANTLLETWQSAARVSMVDKLPAGVRLKDTTYDVGKREFFTSMRDEAKTVASATVEMTAKNALNLEDEPALKYVKVQDDGTLPHYLPNRRRLLLKGLTYLGEPEDVMINTRLWGHVVIETDTCTSCRMCATFCPTGALVKFDEEDGTFGIDHHPMACVKCRCCEHICPDQAIWISDEIFAVDVPTDAVERYVMHEREVELGSKQILNAMKSLIDCDQIYER